MKKLLILILLTSFLGMTLISCFSKPKRVRKPVTSISFSVKSKKLKSGETFQVSYKSDPKNDVLDSVFLFLDNKLIYSGSDLTGILTIETKSLGLGSHSVKAVARNRSGKEGTNYKDFQLLSDSAPENFTYNIVNEYPHSTEHFTQGLQIHKGYLFEGTGENGHSAIYKKDLKTGKILKEVKLDNHYFGEGITILNDKIYQVTYHAQKGFVYDLNSFAKIDSFTYKTKEGWGLTHNGKELIMSDGSEVIRFIDPASFREVRSIQVYNHVGAVTQLNELEYINGKIYANIWLTNKIVKIDANTGKVLAEINLKDILSLMHKNTGKRIDVLNGIAYDEAQNKLYVTGKLWPKLFEIELVKK